MKKRLLCFLIAVLCVLPLALTGCGEGEPVTETGTKPLTLTLYGITGKTTTEEAIKAVEEELNVYTYSLPQTDRTYLENGIMIYTVSELVSLIEDYTG